MTICMYLGALIAAYPLFCIAGKQAMLYLSAVRKRSQKTDNRQAK